MNYTTFFLKLAAKCFAWVFGLTFVLGLIVLELMSGFAGMWYLPLVFSFWACFYAAIPIAIFAGFITALNAFGRSHDPCRSYFGCPSLWVGDVVG